MFMGKEADLSSKRKQGLDVLKCLCCFLVVVLHAPFGGELGKYIIMLARVAVPIFFMITGYFYTATVEKHREIKQIKKILCLICFSNVVFFVWQGVVCVLKRNSILEYLKGLLSLEKWVKFLVFNESPFSGHLWYLNALLYVLVIAYFLNKKNLFEHVCKACPGLLLFDLIFGKYSLVFFGREFDIVFVRNFLFVGIPYFCIGNLIFKNQEKFAKTLSKGKMCIGVLCFAALNIVERYLLIKNNVNAYRDHYLFTTFLAIALFIFFLLMEENKRYNLFSFIGNKCSLEIYIFHPLIVVVAGIAVDVLRLGSIYEYVRPIVVFAASVAFVYAIKLLKIKR